MKFETKSLPEAAYITAPDGSNVRILLSLQGGSMAHFELAAECISRAVAHKSVEEIWHFLAGKGEMWRKLDGYEEIVDVYQGVCITIPVGTHFQFRSLGKDSLKAIAITMPPWPGENEAYFVNGKWKSLI